MRLRRQRHRVIASDHVLAWLGLSAAFGIATILLRLLQGHGRGGRNATAFELRPEAPLADEIRRTARDEITRARDRIAADQPRIATKTVHDSRKRMRKVRSLLRLCRGELGNETFAREDQAVRAIARRLSESRDGRVLVQTLDMLVDGAGDKVAAGSFDGLRTALEREAEMHDEHLASQIVGPGGLLAEMEALLARVDEWTLPEGPREHALHKGLKRIYARGRRAHATAVRHRSDEEALHRLRRRTKDLRHALELSGGRDKAVKRAHELTTLLGDEHDLAVLSDAARRHLITMQPGHEVLLEELIEVRRTELQRDARRLAAKVYADRPAKAVARLLPTGYSAGSSDPRR